MVVELIKNLYTGTYPPPPPPPPKKKIIGNDLYLGKSSMLRSVLRGEEEFVAPYYGCSLSPGKQPQCVRALHWDKKGINLSQILAMTQCSEMKQGPKHPSTCMVAQESVTGCLGGSVGRSYRGSDSRSKGLHDPSSNPVRSTRKP